MAYVLTNLSNEQLEELTNAIRQERKDRIIANINKYPVPALVCASTVDMVKSYRDVHKCSLFEAMTIVEYYRDKE